MQWLFSMKGGIATNSVCPNTIGTVCARCHQDVGDNNKLWEITISFKFIFDPCKSYTHLHILQLVHILKIEERKISEFLKENRVEMLKSVKVEIWTTICKLY